MGFLERKKPNKMFECDVCNYLTSHKNDYNRHLLTRKHNLRTILERKKPISKPDQYTCECGRSYTKRNSLWYHKKKCPEINKIPEICKENTTDFSSNVVLEVLKDNKKLHELVSEQQKQIMELAKQPRMNINNGRFNLNFFLNEQCKNAMTLADFVNSLTVQLNDLEYTKTNGIAQGIREVFMNGLKQLDMYERPIHCTDQKRNTMYIKEKDEWEKDKEYEKLKDSIVALNKKHIAAIKAWEAAHPDWEKNDILTDEYIKIVQSVTNNIDNPENLIIKQVAKEVTIDKID